MITAGAGFQAALDGIGKSPIYACLLAKSGFPTYRFVSVQPTVNGGSYATAAEIFEPVKISRNADPRESAIGIGTFEFILYDHTGDATRTVSAGIEGYQVDLLESYWGEDWSTDSITTFTGIVTEVRLDDGLYRVTARSPLTLAMNKLLFDGAASKLAVAMSVDVKTAVVDNAAGYEPTGGTILIGTERCAYLKTHDNLNGTWTIGGLTRGSESSTKATHAVDDEVLEVFILSGHPFDILKDVFESTDAKAGLDMAVWIDTTDLSTQKTTVGSTLLMRFEIRKGVRAKDWIEGEICKPMACYPYDGADGKLKLKLFDIPSSATISDVIDKTHIVDRARWEGSLERQINAIYTDYDHNVSTDEFGAGFVFRDTSLIQVAGKEFSWITSSRGIKTTEANTETLLDERGTAYTSRFGWTSPLISCRTRESLLLLELGDTVHATFDDLISLPDETRTLTTYPMEVIAASRNFRTHLIDFTLFGFASIVVPWPVWVLGGPNEVEVELDGNPNII